MVSNDLDPRPFDENLHEAELYVLIGPSTKTAQLVVAKGASPTAGLEASDDGDASRQLHQ